jgi:hypothetical protein
MRTFIDYQNAPKRTMERLMSERGIMISSHLRVAILDYPKLQLDRDTATRLLIDMLKSKQANFERTSKSFVVTDKHDMIGTHFLIFDTRDIYQPKLVAAIRNTYEDRAKAHGLALPIESYVGATSAAAQKELREFRRKKGTLVDCNAWFVDPEYSKSNSDLNLSEILFFLVCMYIYRLGHDHLVGATNERYKASRWLNKVGHYKDGFNFIHPSVPDPHKMILVEYFYANWMLDCYKNYGALLDASLECIPDEIRRLSNEEVLASLRERRLKVA